MCVFCGRQHTADTMRRSITSKTNNILSLNNYSVRSAHPIQVFDNNDIKMREPLLNMTGSLHKQTRCIMIGGQWRAAIWASSAAGARRDLHVINGLCICCQTLLVRSLLKSNGEGEWPLTFYQLFKLSSMFLRKSNVCIYLRTRFSFYSFILKAVHIDVYSIERLKNTCLFSKL